MDRLKGAYSLVVMSPRKLIAARDPHGFRPAVHRQAGRRRHHSPARAAPSPPRAASSCATWSRARSSSFDENGCRSIRTHCGCPTGLCVFEYVYIARPDSVVDGASVHRARRRAGAFLALEHPVQADVVIGVPDSGLDAALGYSQQSGIPYGIGFLKNKYIGRTLHPAQPEAAREHRAHQAEPHCGHGAGQARGAGGRFHRARHHLARRSYRLLREAGATEVHFLSSAPQFLYPCYFGVDVDSRENLIAANHTPGGDARDYWAWTAWAF